MYNNKSSVYIILHGYSLSGFAILHWKVITYQYDTFLL